MSDTITTYSNAEITWKGRLVSIIDSLTIDTDGNYSNLGLVNVSGSNIYAVVFSQATSLNGVVRTFTINNDGTVGNTTISSLVFDATCADPHLIYTGSGSCYLVVYEGPSGDGWAKTFTINNQGTISSTISSREFDTADGHNPKAVSVPNSHYIAVAYRAVNNTGKIKTFSINTNNVISTVTDTLIFDAVTNAVKYPSISFLSGSCYAVLYGNQTQTTGTISTFTIDTSGNIGATTISSLVFENAYEAYPPYLLPMDSSKYLITYQGSGNKFVRKSINIDNSGNISNVLYTADHYIGGGTVSAPFPLRTLSPNVYIASSRSGTSSNYIFTYWGNSDGTLGGDVLSSLNYSTSTGTLYNVLVRVSDNVYAVAYGIYTGTLHDTIVKTFSILDTFTVSLISNAHILGYTLITSDALIASQETVYIISNSTIYITEYANTNSNSNIKVVETSTINSNSYIKTTETSSINSNSYVQTLETSNINSDSHISIFDTTSINSNSHIQTIDLSTISSNAHIKITETIIISSDSYIKTTETITINSNSYVLGVEIITSNSNIHSTESTTINSDSYIQIAESATINSDSQILGIVTISSDSYVQTLGISAINSNSTVYTIDVATINLDSNVCNVETVTINSNGHIQATETTIIGLNGHIYVTDTVTIASNSSVYITDTITINSDSDISGRVDTYSNCHIYVTETININSNAWIKLTEAIIYSAATIIDPIEKHKRIPDDSNSIIRETHLDSSFGPDSGFRIF